MELAPAANDAQTAILSSPGIGAGTPPSGLELTMIIMLRLLTQRDPFQRRISYPVVLRAGSHNADVLAIGSLVRL